jgi:transposase
MSHLQGIDRNQTLQFPPRLDDYISAENPVRFLDVFVDQLDLQGMGFSHVEAAVEGRPPYHPGDLLKLYLYGYLNRVRSSRCLERESQRNVEAMWLLKGLTPDHKTIADFRKVHPKALKQVFREFIELCKALKLFGGEIIAIDGSKFLAVNSAQRNYSEKKLEKALKEIDEKLQRYLQALDANDAATPVPSNLAPEQLQQKIEVLKERQAKYRQIQTQLVESGETQISLTDPDSRSMPIGQGTDVAYNVQIAVDGKYKLIAVAEVTNQVTDQAQLSSMATQAKATLEVEALTVLATMARKSNNVWNHESPPILPSRSPLSIRSEAVIPSRIFVMTQNVMSIAALQVRNLNSALMPWNSVATFATTELLRVRIVRLKTNVQLIGMGDGLPGGWMSICWRKWLSDSKRILNIELSEVHSWSIPLVPSSAV